jgi:FtsH-binding integral membrane protein
LVVIPLLAYAVQDTQTDIPSPPFNQLPIQVAAILGALSSTITEFIQRQKSPAVSLAIAVGVSAVGGIVATFVQGVELSDAPVFIVQVFAYATATWGVLFKAARSIFNKGA